MEQFEYKIMFFSHNVKVSKEMIEYNGKTIPGSAILGIGIGLLNVAKIAVGQAVGGILGGFVGGMIRHRSFGDKEEINKSGSLKDLPKSRGQLVITYSPNGPGLPADRQEKMKVQRIPINTEDETCHKMLTKIVETFKPKFIGYGPQALMEGELKISQKAAYIVVAIIVIALIGFGIYAAISEGQF